MPRISHAKHGAGSIRHVAENLKEMAAQLETAAALMDTIPQVESVELPYEQGRADGLMWLQQWADGCRDAVREAKHAVVRAVSDSKKPVSVGDGKATKQKGKRSPNVANSE